MQEIVNRVTQWALGKPTGPFRLEVELTNHCNLKCLFCWQNNPEIRKKVQNSVELSRERWMQLVKEAATLGVRYWQIAGAGEPLCRKDVVEDLLCAIKSNGMEGFLITNGTLFTPAMCNRLVENEWDTIEFSIDGPDSETHDFLRGVPGAFNRALEAVELLVAARKRLNKKRPKLQITAVITNRMHNKLVDFVNLCVKQRIEKLSLNPLILCTDAGAQLKLTPDQERELQDNLIKAEHSAHQQGLDNNFRDLINTGMVEHTGQMTTVIKQDVTQKKLVHPFIKAACYSPFHVLEIRPDGKIGPCCIHYGESDYLTDKSLSDVWFGAYLTNFRTEALAGRLPDFCKNCAAGLVMENRRIREALEQYFETQHKGVRT